MLQCTASAETAARQVREKKRAYEANPTNHRNRDCGRGGDAGRTGARATAAAGAAPDHHDDGRSLREQSGRRRRRTFPLAAPAGQDSGAKQTAPAGAVNQGAFDPATWKYGTAFQRAGRIEGLESGEAQAAAGRQGHRRHVVFGATDPSTYCAMANAGYDFIWTEMQHGQTDWNQVARMWRTCPHAKAVPGVRVAYTDEREIQHALDAGALVVVVPTVDTVGRGNAGARLDLLSAARPAQQRRRPGVRCGDVGRRARRLSQHRQRQHRV